MNALQMIALLATGIGAFYAASDWSRQHAADGEAASAQIVAPAPRPAPSQPTAGPPTADPLAALNPVRARPIPSGTTGAFNPLNWQPPPPPPPPPVAALPPPPPPAPTAPPLPFTFVGMVEQGADVPRAYLAKGDVLLIVAQGDVIDNKTYRIDALLPTGVVLTYLPLNKQQTLNAPGAGQ